MKPFESYEEMVSYLKNLPMTYYPDLIRVMVEAAYTKNVFVKNGASTLIKKFEDRMKPTKRNIKT